MNPASPSTIPRKKPHAAAAAETLVAEILTYIAEEAERLTRLFDLTGLTPHSIRHAATQPEFAASLLDYLASDERLVLDFAVRTGHDPAELEAVRRSLQAPNLDTET